MDTLLKNNSKAIIHLRQQLKNHRIGLVFGAGSSHGLDFPSWNNLIESIAKHPDVDSEQLYTSIKQNISQANVTDVLFHHFKLKKEIELKGESDEYFLNKRILSDWREVIHQCLYTSALENREENLKKHPYLNDFIPILQKTEVTINYNFDDTLEFMLSLEKNEKTSKPYQVIWDSYSQYKVGVPVIYHPNGFLPGDKNSQQSEKLIFSEESFSNQLLDSMSGKFAFILNLFTKKTCLLVGLSLEDITLKHLLRQSAVLAPGNYHYYIKYTSDKSALSDSEKQAIYNSNFEVYNLITLFFDDNDISLFTKCITYDDDNFQRFAEENEINIKYVYYFVGSVAVGKSSILSHFGNCQILEEWIDDRPANLAKPFPQLLPKEVIEVDTWTNNQFYKKNNFLYEKKEGIFLVDRTPLDPISFTANDEKAKNRAIQMLQGIAPGHSHRQIVPGHVIFLQSDSKEQQGRLLTKRKLSWNEVFLDDLNKKTNNLYESIKSTELINSRKKLHNIVKDVSKVIFSTDYKPQNLHERLESISKGS